MRILEYWAPKGVAFTLYYPAYDGEWSSQYVTSPAGLDSEASIDKTAFADCTNEWTEIGSSGVGYLDLTADEMNNGEIVVQTKSSTAGVNFPLVVIRTYIDPFTAAQAELTEMPDPYTASPLDLLRALAIRGYGNTLFDRLTGAVKFLKADGTTVLGEGTATDDGDVLYRGAITTPEE